MCRENATTMGLIGTGGQARAHFRFLTRVRPIRKAKVFSPNSEHRKIFSEEMGRENGIDVEPVESAEQAVKGTDLICTATSTSSPIMKGAWLEPGVHFNSIREFEVDETVFSRSDIIGIHTRQGGIQHHLPAGLQEDLPGIRRERPRDWSRYPEIGDLLTGKVPGRTSEGQITFFLNNIGAGVQFATMGYTLYRSAKEKGLGREIPSEWFLQDIKP